MDYKIKYLKYKIKYSKLLKEQHGGSKENAKQIADWVHSINIFDKELSKLSLDQISEFMFNIYISENIGGTQVINLDKKKIIIKLLESLKNKFLVKKYYHNIINKDIKTSELTNDIIGKKYENKTVQCTNLPPTPTPTIQKFINYPHSGMHTNKNKYFVNKLPNLLGLPEITTYNYVLLYVTDMETNQTYYYFVFVQYTNNFEYAIKHSNLRVFLPKEWEDNININHGLIASGELEINTLTKKIIFDFNSSSIIIMMYISPIVNVYKPNYIMDSFITDYIDPSINKNTQKKLIEQLFALIYIFVSNHTVSYSIKKIIELDPSYSEFTIDIHPDYKSKDKLLIVAKNDPELIYTYGLYNDPYPHKLGGLHNYLNNRCYTDDELIKFNNESANQFQDFDDNNIDTMNCIYQNNIVKIHTGNDNKDFDFSKKCKSLLN